MRIVNVESGECTCMYSNEFGLPCIHASFLIRENESLAHKFIDYRRTAGALKQVYAGYIAMIDIQQLRPSAIIGAVIQRRRGRPRNGERIRSQVELLPRIRRSCSMCAQQGHDKRQCPRNPSNLNEPVLE
ncbi:hypothetical protein ENBRE01_1684 [Enteropsectra breve]|nr:hypothetical protein ENBRE01_1684 [Enteropsectra breve]